MNLVDFVRGKNWVSQLLPLLFGVWGGCKEVAYCVGGGVGKGIEGREEVRVVRESDAFDQSEERDHV